MSSHYIMEWKHENGFKVNIVTEGPNAGVCNLMNGDLFLAIREDCDAKYMHPAIRILAKNHGMWYLEEKSGIQSAIEKHMTPKSNF